MAKLLIMGWLVTNLRYMGLDKILGGASAGDNAQVVRFALCQVENSGVSRHESEFADAGCQVHRGLKESFGCC